MLEQEREEIAVTVVVPIYNTPEALLKRMLDSLLKQRPDEVFEILLIDDGSEKEIADCLDRLVVLSSNIYVHHLENQGVSGARNYGIKHARGEYIAFVDGDDMVSEDFLKEALDRARQYDADIVYGRLLLCDDKLQPVFRKGGDCSADREKEYIVEEADMEQLQMSLLGYSRGKFPCSIIGSPCGRLFRTSLAKETLFDPDISFSEDQIFNQEIAKKASRAVITSCLWYYYIQYRNSAMNSASLGEDFYNKVKPYWDYSYKQILEADGELKYAARVMGLCKLIELIQAGYVYSPMSLPSKCRAIRNAAQHPLIIEVASNLEIKDSRLGKMEKLKLLLIKSRWWLVLYILVSLYYRRNRK